jgi:hypothetical protein
LVALILLVACGRVGVGAPQPVCDAGGAGRVDLADAFTYVAGETWTLENPAGDSLTVEADGTTLSWSRADVYSVAWDVTNDGVFVTSWTAPDGSRERFDPPIHVALALATTGDCIATSSGGFDFTAIFLGYDTCPVVMDVDWGDDCTAFTLDDGDGDPATHAGLVGTYWTIPRFDLVGWQGETDGEPWGLAGYACTGPEC